MAEQVLELQITDNESQVEGRLDKLVASLKSVKSAVGKGLGLGDIATDLSRLGKTVNDDISGSTFQKIKDLAAAIEQLRNASKGIKLPNLSSLFGGSSDTVNNETNKTNENIDKVSTMLNRYKEVADGITSSINENITNLTTAIQEQTSAISEYKSTLSAFSGSATGTSVAETTSDSAEAIGEVAEAVSTAGEEMAVATSAMETASDAADDIGEGFADAQQEIASAEDSVEGVRNAIESVKSIDDYLGMSKVDLLKLKLDEVRAKFAEGLGSEKGLDASKIVDYTTKIQKLTEEIEKLQATSSTLSSLKKGFQNLLSPLTKVMNQFGRTARGRLFRYMIRSITSAVKTGIENMKGYSSAIGSSFATSMTSASNSFAKLKNSIGAAAAPLIETLIPYLQQVISWVISAINYFNQFISLLAGKTSWTKATDAATSATDKVKQSASGASDAIKELLADFDELNVIQSETDSSGGGTTKATTDYSKMFEEVDEYSEKIKNLVNTLKGDIDYIKTAVIAIGAAILAWKISEAFSQTLPTLSTIAGLFASGAAAVATITLSVMFMEDYLETGETGFLLASILTTALGTTVTAAMAQKALGGNAGAIAAGVTLALTAAANIITTIKNKDVSALDKETVLSNIVSAIEAGGAAGILLKTAGMTEGILGTLWAVGGTALLVFGVATAMKAIADVYETGEITQETVIANAIASLTAGLGAIGLSVALGASGGWIIASGGGAALLTFGVACALEMVLSDKEHIDYEQFAKDIFSSAGDNGVSVAKVYEALQKEFDKLSEGYSLAISTFSENQSLKTDIEDALTTINGLHALISGDDALTQEEADNFKTAWETVFSAFSQVQNNNFTIILDGLREALTSENDIIREQAKELRVSALMIEKNLDEAAAKLEVAMETLVSKIVSGTATKEEIEQYNEYLQALADYADTAVTDLEKVIKGAENIDFGDSSTAIENATQFIKDVANAADSAVAKIDEGLASQLAALDDTKSKIDMYVKQGLIDAKVGDSMKADLDKMGETYKAVAQEKKDQIAEDVAGAYKTVIDQANAGIAELIGEGGQIDEEAIETYAYTVIDTLVAAIGEAGGDVDEAYRQMLNIDDFSSLTPDEQMDALMQYVKEKLGEAAADAGITIDLGEYAEVQWNNFKTDEARAAYVKTLVDTYGSDSAIAALKSQLKLDASTMIQVSGWDDLSTSERESYVAAMVKAYGSADTVAALKSQIPDISPEEIFNAIDWTNFTTEESFAFINALKDAFGAEEAKAAAEAAGMDISDLVAEGMESGNDDIKAAAAEWDSLISEEIEQDHDVGVSVDENDINQLKEDVNGDLTFDGKVVPKPDMNTVNNVKGEVEEKLKDTKANIIGSYTGGDISGTVGQQMGLTNMKATVGNAAVTTNAVNKASDGFKSVKATIKSATVGKNVASNLGKNMSITPKISVGANQKKDFKSAVKGIDATNTPNLLTDSGFKGDVSKIKTANTPELNLSDTEKKKISDAVSKINASISVTASLANASAFGEAFTTLFNKLKIEFTSGVTKTVMSVKAFFSGGYAEGGFPNSGQLFMARENGMSEYVGSMGGHTAVANNDQIVEGISRGVASANEEQNALLRRQNQLLMQLLQKKWSLQPSAALGRDVNRSLEMLANMTGG